MNIKNLKIRKNISLLLLSTTLITTSLSGCNDNNHQEIDGNYYILRYANNDIGIAKRGDSNSKLLSINNTIIAGTLDENSKYEYSNKKPAFFEDNIYCRPQLIPLDDFVEKDTIYKADINYFSKNKEKTIKSIEENYKYPKIIEDNNSKYTCKVYKITTIENEEYYYVGYQAKLNEINSSVIYDIISSEVIYFNPLDKVTELENLIDKDGITVNEAKKLIEKHNFQNEQLKETSKQKAIKLEP